MVNPSPEASLQAGEAELIGRSQQGDLDAFNVLVERYQRPVYSVCFRMLGSTASAEDAAQDAFFSAYRSIRTFNGASFRAWLMRIATNACTDELRRRGRRPALSLDAPRPDTGEPLEAPDPAPGPEAEALRHEQQRVVQAALLELPADQRVAVIMCDIHGFAYEEIAEAMRTSMGTVKSRIARGREKLRRALIARGGTIGPGGSS